MLAEGSTDSYSPDFDPHAGPVFQGGDKGDWRELETKLPAFPDAQKLISFEVLPSGGFSFYVDPDSIVPGTDGIVRYTTVVRSRSGALNVSYNGLRCGTNQHRVFATGRPATRDWLPVQDGRWEELRLGGLGRQHLVLMRDFFCPAGIAITTRKEGVNALREGGHPDSNAIIRQFNDTR